MPTESANDTFDSRAVRRHFSRAAASYDSAAVLQREVGVRLAGGLDAVRLVPGRILDAGCGTGDALPGLGTRYPGALRVGLDIALPMLDYARGKTRVPRSLAGRLLAPLRPGREAPEPAFACADIAALPLAAGSVDLIWSSLALQWVSDLPRAFAEFLRVLRVDGLLTFATFGPDTLRELRDVFARVDGTPHVSPFLDLHDIGDMLVATGFADPVLRAERFTLTYEEPMAMLRDLKAIGATNARRDRERGLMGRARWKRVLAGLDALRGSDSAARLPATYEVVYGHAWKTAPTRSADGRAVINVVRRAQGAR